VVRGWQAATGSAVQRPATPAPPAGPVDVSGRAYPSETGGLGTDLPDRQIQHIDTAAIGRRLGTGPSDGGLSGGGLSGGGLYDGYVELASQRPDPGTLAVLPAPELTNPAGGADEWQHLAYVVQWFCFAALALAAPVLLAVLELRESPAASPAARRHDAPVDHDVPLAATATNHADRGRAPDETS
jgi:cytochrome oxidase assembly protein ShyY1